MDREECRERILSEDYLDFISPVYRAVTQQEIEGRSEERRVGRVLAGV